MKNFSGLEARLRNVRTSPLVVDVFFLTGFFCGPDPFFFFDAFFLDRSVLFGASSSSLESWLVSLGGFSLGSFCFEGRALPGPLRETVSGLCLRAFGCGVLGDAVLLAGLVELLRDFLDGEALRALVGVVWWAESFLFCHSL